MFKTITTKFLEGNDERNLNQFLAVFSGSIGFFICGIHGGWPTPSLPRLLKEFNISEDEASYIIMISNVGHVIGGLLGGFLIDKIGRKFTILLVTVPQFLGFFLTYCFTFGTYWLYIARIFGGMAEGATVAVVPAYVSEVTNPNLRGACGTILCLQWPVGSVFITVLGSYLTIPTTALISLIFPVILFLTFSIMPESPYYLLMRQKVDEAEHSLKILRRTTKIKKEMLSLTEDVTRQMSETGKYKDLFRIPANRKAFCLAAFMRCFQQFAGATTILAYSQLLIVQTTNFSPVVGSTLLISIRLLMYIPIFFLVDKVGRKVLIQLSASLDCITLTLLGTFFLLKDYFLVDMSGISWLPLVIITCYMCVHGLGLGDVVAVYISEIFSSSIKSKALGLSSIIYAGSMMSSIKMYQYTSDNLSQAVPFYIFALVTLVNILISYKFVPETKGKTLEMIQQELRKK